MSKKYRDIRESVEIFSILEGTLKDISLQVAKLQAEYGDDAELELDAGYNHVEARITYTRLETEAERNQRLKTAKKKRLSNEKQKQVTEKREREIYERLKRKYEK